RIATIPWPKAAPWARLLAAAAILLLLAPAADGRLHEAAAQSQDFTPSDEAPEQFPDGPGREDTFYACTACHGFKLVAQQGMNRRQWEETLDWMTEKHGMPELQGADRTAVLDYLEATYPPRAAPGRSPNP